MARVFLILTALVFAGFGVWGLVEPSAIMQRFDVALPSGEAKTAIRAMYGGFLIGAGALFAFCAIAEKRVALGLQAVLILNGSILINRVIGMWLDGGWSSFHLTYAALEVGGVLVSALFLWSRRSNSGTTP